MAQAELPKDIGYIQPSTPSMSREAQLYTPFRKYLTLGHTIQPKLVVLYISNNTISEVTWLETTGESDEGISGDLATPILLDPLESVKTIFTISNEGDLNYLYTLTFASDGDTSPLFIIDGTRAKVLSGDIAYMFHGHNWDSGFEDNLEWKTDILESYDNNEQRIKLRSLPRRSWGIKYLLDKKERRNYEIRLSLRRTRYFLIPNPTDVRVLTEDVLEGTTIVNVHTHGLDYESNGLMAIWSSNENYEVLYVDNVAPEYVSTNGVWKSDWPKGSFFAPCRLGTVLNSRNIARASGDTIVTSYEFKPLDVSSMPIVDVLATYKSLYVFPFPINFKDISSTIDNSWLTLDNETSKIVYEIKDIEPINNTSLSVIIEGRDDIYTLYSFLFHHAGSYGACYIPMQDKSLNIVFNIIEGTNYITIENIFYTTELLGSPLYSDIQIELNDDTILRFGVSSSEYDEFNNETIYLDGTFDNNITLTELKRVCWLQKSRLSTDSLTFKWVTSDTLELDFPMVTVK